MRWGDGDWYIYPIDTEDENSSDYDTCLMVHVDLDNSLILTMEEILEDRSYAAHKVLKINDNIDDLGKLYRVFDQYIHECGNEDNRANKSSKKR